jgi:tetratricopeptide (TPR) repeat protein
VLEHRVDREIADASAARAYQLHLELAVTYRARGRLADALREFDAASALQPSRSDLQVLRALTLEAGGRFEEAANAFRRAWTLDPRNPVKAYYVAERTRPDSIADQARELLVDTYRNGAFGAGRRAAPFAVLEAIPDNLSRTPVVGDAATSRAFALLNARQYGEAVAELGRGRQTIAGANAESPLAHFEQARRDEAETRVTAARHEYQIALEGAFVGRSVLLVAIGRLAQVDGDLPGASDAFTRAVRLNPNDPMIHKELAGAYAAQGRGDEAFCELMAAVLIDAGDAQAHAAIGQLYLDQGREAEAVGALDRALALSPDRYEIRYALAMAHLRMGNTAEAARQLDIFDHASKEALERRRHGIAREVDREQALPR